MRFVLCSLIVLLGSSPALARDIFVNNLSGDDLLTGRAPVSQGRGNGPVRTISKALRLAQGGDRIVLADTKQPYREEVTVQAGRNSGVDLLLRDSPGGYVTGLAGDDEATHPVPPEDLARYTVPLVIDGGGATLEGFVDIPHDRWESAGGDIFRFAPQIKSHQVLLLEGKRAVQVPVERGSHDLPKLEPLQWCLLDGYIYLRVQPTQIPQQYYPACAGLQTGITFYEVHDVVLRNLTVRGFALDGINCHDNAFRVTLQNVIAEDNGRSGFSIGGASRVRLDQCQAGFNLFAQVRTEGYSRTELFECQLDDSAAPATMSANGSKLVTP